MSENVTNFVWCALVAVEIARSDGRIQTQEGERIFIKKWLQEAKKEKRFCQDVTPVLLALLKLNKLYGASISVREILNYYWLSGTESLRKQTDFYRLHCALTLLQFPAAKKLCFHENKQTSHSNISPNKKIKTFIDNETLSRTFDKNGNLTSPLTIKVEFNIYFVKLVMQIFNFNCSIYEKDMFILSSAAK